MSLRRRHSLIIKQARAVLFEEHRFQAVLAGVRRVAGRGSGPRVQELRAAQVRSRASIAVAQVRRQWPLSKCARRPVLPCPWNSDPGRSALVLDWHPWCIRPACRLTPPSSGRAPASFACLRTHRLAIDPEKQKGPEARAADPLVRLVPARRVELPTFALRMARHQQSAVNHNKKASQNQRVSSLPLRWSAVENGSFSWASVPAVCQAAGAKRFRKLVHA